MSKGTDLRSLQAYRDDGRQSTAQNKNDEASHVQSARAKQKSVTFGR